MKWVRGRRRVVGHLFALWWIGLDDVSHPSDVATPSVTAGQAWSEARNWPTESKLFCTWFFSCAVYLWACGLWVIDKFVCLVHSTRTWLKPPRCEILPGNTIYSFIYCLLNDISALLWPNLTLCSSRLKVSFWECHGSTSGHSKLACERA